MPLPANTPLSQLANALRLDAPHDRKGWSSFELVPPIASDAGGPVAFDSQINVWYPSNATANPESLCNRIEKELASLGHTFNGAIARALLGLACIRNANRRDAIEFINELLLCACHTKCYDYLIAGFPTHPVFSRYRLNDFEVGPLDREKLMHLCRAIKCDYFDRYPERHQGSFTIARADPNAFLIPPREIVARCDGLYSRASNVVANYYRQLAQSRRAQFKEQFMEAQYVPVAAGANLVDVEDTNFWFGSSFICAFTWKRPGWEGWLTPLGIMPSIDFASADVKLRSTLQALDENYRFERLGESDFHKLLKTFCRFVTLAVQQLTSGGQGENGFLYYVIALDLVFGEKDSSNRSITKRVAIVSSRNLVSSYANIVDTMKDLYAIRSKFVHSGDPVPRNAVDLVLPIVNAVFNCLMRVQMKAEAHEVGYPGRWLRDIDFIAAAEEANRPILDSDLQEAGII